MAGGDRFPALRSSEGYDTEGKEEFEYKLQFNFDYSDMDVTYRDVKKQLSDFSYELNKALSLEGIPKSRTGGGMFYISPKAAASLPKAEGGILDQMISLVPDGKAIEQSLAPAMGQLGQDGKSTMMKYANRVETGAMKGSIRYDTKRYANKYTVNIGWTQLWYKYFGFQENGTSTVRPMRSILRTYLELTPRVQNFMSRFIRTYTTTGSKGVNYR